MKQYRHIIWDWNGTLFDDADLCIAIINRLLQARRMPELDEARYQGAFTFPVRDFYRDVGFDFAIEPFETIAAEFIADYDRERFACPLQSGALPVLRALAERGYTQSVLSAYEQTRLEEMIAFYRLGGFFSHIIGLNDYYASCKIEQGKQYLALLDYPPGDVAMVGDSLHDAEVAAAMGIDCLLVPGGHYARERLLTAGVPVVASLSELLDLLPGAALPT